MPDLLSVEQAAQRLGMSTGRLRQLIRRGSVPALRVGRAWVVKEADLQAYEPRPIGWPKGRLRGSRVK